MSVAVETESSLYALRQAVAGDVPFLCDSWLKSYYSDFRWLQQNQVDAAAYWEGERALIGNILERSVVTVACNPNHADQIFGYVAFEPEGRAPVPVVHWLYVKQKFRNLGIGRELLSFARSNAKTIYCSHWTQLCAGKRDQLGLIYQPFSAVKL